MGRPRNEVCNYFEDLGRGRFQCNKCRYFISAGGGRSRMKALIKKRKSYGVHPCTAIPQFNNEADEDSQLLQYLSQHLSVDTVMRDMCGVKEDEEEDDEDHDNNENSISEISVNDFSRWEKGENIGAGGFGIVYLAQNRESGDLCAVKEIKNIQNVASIQKEITILSQLKHPNIVKYYGHDIDGQHISLYMEYIQPGSLKKYMKDQGGLDEPLIQNFTYQILSGLVYLHSERVVHRDIKPDNLLVDVNKIVKLVDFGLAKHLAESMGKHSEWGTVYYVAPEVLDNKEYESSREASAADIWSLGCVVMEMLTGNRPWSELDHPFQVLYKVHFGGECPPIPDKLCEEAKDFLKLCFTRTPADRPSAVALLDHPFVKKAQTT